MEALGRMEEAKECYIAASRGNCQLVPAMYYNDQKPDKIFYQGLALRKLGSENEARSKFNSLISYGENICLIHSRWTISQSLYLICKFGKVI